MRGGQDAFTDEEQKRVPELRVALKNAVLHHLIDLRRKNSVNSLCTILKKGVKKMIKIKAT